MVAGEAYWRSNTCRHRTVTSHQTPANMTVTSPLKHLHNIWQWQVPSNICTTCDSDKSHQTSAQHTTVTSPIKHLHMTITSPLKHLHNIWQWQVSSNICTPYISDKSHQTPTQHTSHIDRGQVSSKHMTTNSSRKLCCAVWVERSLYCKWLHTWGTIH